MEVLSIYLYNLLAVVGLMLLGWLISLAQRNVTIVDTLWGLGFVLVAWLTWFQAEGYAGRQMLVLTLTTAWGLRLAAYLTWRNHGKEEDPRYGQWRRASGDRFWLTSLFKVFLLQALFLWLIALVVQAGLTSSLPAAPGLLDLAGTLIWGIGFFFEAVGDWQMARFKADPANQGKVMDRGLWRYTRHPNYFGECLMWWGLFVIVVSDPGNAWTVVSPLIISVVLLKMTGIALTEKLSVEKRPGYREYTERTPAFFPWKPKQRPRAVEPLHENIDPVG